jgi:hypothetical protein
MISIQHRAGVTSLLVVTFLSAAAWAMTKPTIVPGNIAKGRQNWPGVLAK